MHRFLAVALFAVVTFISAPRVEAAPCGSVKSGSYSVTDGMGSFLGPKDGAGACARARLSATFGPKAVLVKGLAGTRRALRFDSGTEIPLGESVSLDETAATSVPRLFAGEPPCNCTVGCSAADRFELACSCPNAAGSGDDRSCMQEYRRRTAR